MPRSSFLPDLGFGQQPARQAQVCGAAVPSSTPNSLTMFARTSTPRDLFDRNIAAFDDAAVVHDPQHPTPLTGKAAIETNIAQLFTAYPDTRAEVKHVLVDGDTVAGLVVITGTHQGPMTTPLGEIPPTGKQVTNVLATFATMGPQGTCTEERRVYDVAALMAQLGLTG